jgi:hypothetical protein
MPKITKWIRDNLIFAIFDGVDELKEIYCIRPTTPEAYAN